MGLLGALIVAFAIIIYVNRVLKRFRKISAAEAIRFGIAQDDGIKSKCLLISENRLFHPNIFLGIKDVLARKSLYATMLAVLIISAFIMIVPQNLYNMISSKNFITYMGIGKSDLRLDIQQIDNINEKTTGIVERIEADSDILKYSLLTTKTYTGIMEDGSTVRLKVELRDHTQFLLEYSKGRAPTGKDEFALSVINARELSKTIGDSVPLLVNGEEKVFAISGIYSDITNGGKTAKVAFTDDTAETMWSVINIC